MITYTWSNVVLQPSQLSSKQQEASEREAGSKHTHNLSYGSFPETVMHFHLYVFG